ncbi:dihydrofolate reductase [Nematocida homosporus]|uniref:dihydrofolate reductase n=1 Tax=Nematocida homosporus TaxID=1912981 RepID=UPI00221E9689|nr:dihydrofolate reductase [Nematocida homosporus]KAI5184585.1 dihydrofolate reductase [Nematocida homosporus]
MTIPLDVALIAAISRPTGVIGHKNTLPWPRLSADFHWLKQLTTQVPTGLIMGRATYDSIGKPLPGRTMVVLTSQVSVLTSGSYPSLYYVPNLTSALDFCTTQNLRPIIFGGSSLYTEALQTLPCTIYLTLIEDSFTGDRHFPMHLIDPSKLTNITSQATGQPNLTITQSGLTFGFYTMFHTPNSIPLQ